VSRLAGDRPHRHAQGLRRLAEEVRRHLLTLIASESGVDGMDLAVKLAFADPSPAFQGETVLQLLICRA